MSWVRWVSKPQIVKGIQVGDLVLETREYFLQLIDQALTLIANSDPLRWRRVQREIRVITSACSVYPSSYGRAGRICMVDLRYFYLPNEPHLIVPLLASELIYQATFGYLCTRAILRTRKNAHRFDRLRSQEAGRFLRRCPALADLSAASELFDWEPRHQGCRRLLNEFRAVMTSEPAAEAALWKGVLRRMNEPQ